MPLKFSGGGSADVDRVVTTPQRFKVGIPHIDPTAWSVPMDGTTDASAALQNMVDNGMTGAVVRFPPGRMRVASTVKAPATKYGIHWEAAGGRSYNEDVTGIPGAAFVGDAGVTVLQIGNDTPTTTQYRGPTIKGLTFREAGDAKTATMIDMRALCNWTLEDLNFRGANIAVKVDASGSFDASWGHLLHPMISACNRGVHALGSDFVVTAGNFSVTEWGLYMEPKGSVTCSSRLLGTKIDVAGTGGIYSEGAFLSALGVNMELSGGVNNQVGYRFVSNVAKHANSGRANRIYGGVISGSTGTGHTGVDIGAGCIQTEIDGTALANITTKITNAGSATSYHFAGDPFITDRTVGTTHYEMQDGSGAALMRQYADASTSAMWQMVKSGGKVRIKLGGAVAADEIQVQDSSGNNLFRFQGNGGSTYGTSAGTQTINGALKHAGTTVGFNGATPVSKAANPGTATGTDAAVLNAVVTALRNLGLVT